MYRIEPPCLPTRHVPSHPVSGHRAFEVPFPPPLAKAIGPAVWRTGGTHSLGTNGLASYCLSCCCRSVFSYSSSSSSSIPGSLHALYKYCCNASVRCFRAWLDMLEISRLSNSLIFFTLSWFGPDDKFVKTYGASCVQIFFLNTNEPQFNLSLFSLSCLEVNFDLLSGQNLHFSPLAGSSTTNATDFLLPPFRSPCNCAPLRRLSKALTSFRFD